MANVIVVDTGVVNIKNILRGLVQVGCNPQCSEDPDQIALAEKLVLPGVGAFGAAMAVLRSKSLDDAIRYAMVRGSQILGICLGMQLLMETSEENGTHVGLGLIPGRVIPIPSGKNAAGQTIRKVPHIGWTALDKAEDHLSWSGSVLQGLPVGVYCYFAHSFMVEVEKRNTILAETDYLGLPIASAITNENISGVQFHPERSGKDGLAILKNFSEK